MSVLLVSAKAGHTERRSPGGKWFHFSYVLRSCLEALEAVDVTNRDSHHDLGHTVRANQLVAFRSLRPGSEPLRSVPQLPESS